MQKVTTKFLTVGTSVVLDGKVSEVLSIRKAWKAPEYIITFTYINREITRVCHSNTKWDVFPKVVA